MPVAYPFALRTFLRDTKSRSQPAAFRIAEPRRGFGYVEPTGTDTPVFWDITHCFTRTEAAQFRLWFTQSLLDGTLTFTIPVDTEFGLQTYELQYLPDSLLPARQQGEMFTYTATVMARAELIPAAALTDYALDSTVTVPMQYLTVGVAYSLSLSTYWPAGTGPFTWSVVSGTLPAGLTLNSASGVLSGTPLIAATFADLVFRRTGAYGAPKDSEEADFIVSVADPSFANVGLLLRGNGSLADSSTFNRTPAAVGGIASATDASAFGGQSIRCLSGTTANHVTYTASFSSSTALWTLDFWMRINDTVGAGAGAGSDRGQFIRLGNTALSQLITANGQVNSSSTHLFAIAGNTAVNWATYGLSAATDRVFVRIVRENSSGLTTLFYSGRYIGQGSYTGAIDNIRVGNPGNATCNTGAYIDELRFTDGVARSTRSGANVGDVVFTVPSGPFPGG